MPATRSGKKGEEEEAISEETRGMESILKETLLKEFLNFKTSMLKEIKELGVKLEQDMISKLNKVDKNTSAMREMMESFKTSLEFTQEDVRELKTVNSTVEKEVLDLKVKNETLNERLNSLERYSRGFNLRFNGIAETPDEDCKTLVAQIIQSLSSTSSMDCSKEIENAHRTGKSNDKFAGRQIIVKFYSRPFKEAILRASRGQSAKDTLGKVRVMEDFTPTDFQKRKKALPLMLEAFNKGEKVRFTKGKLIIEGKLMQLT